MQLEKPQFYVCSFPFLPSSCTFSLLLLFSFVRYHETHFCTDKFKLGDVVTTIPTIGFNVYVPFPSFYAIFLPLFHFQLFFLLLSPNYALQRDN